MVMQGHEWIIDNRIVVDLCYDHYVFLMDAEKQKGIKLKSLKNNDDILLKVIK
jgi:hypothetical protein